MAHRGAVEHRAAEHVGRQSAGGLADQVGLGMARAVLGCYHAVEARAEHRARFRIEEHGPERVVAA